MADIPLVPPSGGIIVVKYAEAFHEQWESFVAQSFQGTLFHTRAFLAYHPTSRFEDSSLLFFKKKKLLALLPAAFVQSESRRVLVSHPGASFGGFVTSSLNLREQCNLLLSLQRYAREHNCAAIELALPPICYQQTDDQSFAYALYHAGFRLQRCELTQAVRLEAQREQNYSAEFQRKIRRAQMLGVVVQESDDLADFYGILLRNLAERHGAQPAHTLEELLDLRRRLPERVRLFAAFAEEKMIAGYLLFVCNKQAALAFYIAQIYEAQHYRAINLLAHEVMNWCAREGLAYFDFGTSTINAEPNWGLIDFREAAGARGFWRERWRLEVKNFDAISIVL